LSERAVLVGRDVYDADAYRLSPLDDVEYSRRLAFYLQRRAWAEWYFGTVTPARQIALLPDTEVELRLRLARQIADEIRHHDVFAALLRSLGIQRGPLDQFEPPSGLLAMHNAQVEGLSAADLAASNQFSGEIVLMIQSRRDNNVLRDLLPVQVLAAIDDIEGDEPAHIALGHDLVVRGATGAATRRQLARAQELFLRGLITQHITEIEALGAERIRPAPTIQG
jgi:hypothetical protein